MSECVRMCVLMRVRICEHNFVMVSMINRLSFGSEGLSLDTDHFELNNESYINSPQSTRYSTCRIGDDSPPKVRIPIPPRDGVQGLRCRAFLRVGKDEKNPLWAVRAPGHTGMPSARDCPMGVLLIRHLGTGDHVKFAVRTETSRGFRETLGAHRIDDL
ncbi:hypothetical protein EVAR_40036_1 [Eumeta japonica]|uniref:Uncharacterized protein n=1 Tax=Eumeta variegata TaxID=151549 RepID=A0A4C1W9U3_EUMVA|nr:hypothetical protein EVAR_40036_1 [Eumeta japonica]